MMLWGRYASNKKNVMLSWMNSKENERSPRVAQTSGVYTIEPIPVTPVERFSRRKEQAQVTFLEL